jgi:hypothetical protein
MTLDRQVETKDATTAMGKQDEDEEDAHLRGGNGEGHGSR